MMLLRVAALLGGKVPLRVAKVLPLLLLALALVLICCVQVQGKTEPKNAPPSKVVVGQLVTAINDLARSLATQTVPSASAKAEIFSPVSIGSMMFLLLRAANRELRNEILTVLRLEQFGAPGASPKITKNFARLLKEFTHDIAGKGILDELPGWHAIRGCYPGQNDDYVDDVDGFYDIPVQPNVVQLANGVFLQGGLVNISDFGRLAQDLYQAHIERVNFREQPEAAQATINRWVSENTRGRIPQILPDAPPSTTQLVLANALYFKGTWATYFNDPRMTRPRPFYPDGEDQPSVQVPAMFTSDCFPYHASAELDASIMAFPYRNRTTSMYVILPNASNRARVRQLQAKLGSAELDRLIAQMYPRKAMVQLPRMHLTNNYDLRAALEQLGVKTLFDPTRNSLKFGPTGGSGGKGAGSRKLFVDKMLHKIDLQVNESGTEGAAVTMALMERSMPPVVFDVRGPFLIAIRHDPTKMLLFYGAVYDPS